MRPRPGFRRKGIATMGPARTTAGPQGRGSALDLCGIENRNAARCGRRGGWTVTTSHALARSRGDYARCFVMPSFFIRDRSVLGLIPSRAAAPSGPCIRPLVAASACRMWIRSLSSSVTMTSWRATGATGAEHAPLTGRSSSRISTTGPGLSTQARSITFCSSRMLPGQG